ncbi:MAG: PHP domain-containing protein [Armatimonadota bacterium]|nr:PHP domain-containing protein [Armatimonadota bacterium]
MTNSDTYLQCDFHVHTRYSPCAQSDMLPGSIIEAAKEQGIKYLGLVDHIFGFTDASILKSARKDCPPDDGSIEVFFGCEADVLSVGKTTVTQEMMDALDYIMVSANHFHNDWLKLVDLPESDDPQVVGKHFLKMFNYAASLEYADVIAHPFYVMPGTYDIKSIYLLTEKDIAPGIEAAAKNKVAVEISRRAITQEHVEFMLMFYRLCKEAGVKFSVGSDSHMLSTVGQMRLLVEMVEELDLRQEDFWLPRKNGGER